MKKTKTTAPTFRRTLSVALVASLALGALPVWAADKDEAQPVRASIERVLDQREAQTEAASAGQALSAPERAEVAARARALPVDPVAGQSAGGGAAKALFITLLSTAVTLGITYMIMKKTQEQVKAATGQ